MTAGPKQPYVRFFFSDWLGGTRGMRAGETGIYITLIALMYENGEPLVEDHRRLARQCGCTPKTFATVLDMLVEDHKVIKKDGGLWNKRVAEEFKWREKSSTTAREAASSRWEKPNKNNGKKMQSHSECNADAMPYQNPEPYIKKGDLDLKKGEGCEPEIGPEERQRIAAGMRDLKRSLSMYEAGKPPDRPKAEADDLALPALLDRRRVAQ